MKLRFLYAILLMAIVLVKAEEDVDTDNILDNKDFDDIVNKENSGIRGRSLNVDVKNNGKETTEPGNGEENTELGNGKETNEPGNGKENTEPGNGKETNEPGNGKDTTEPGNGEETTGPGNGEETTELDNGEETTGPGNGEETTEPGNGKETTEPGNGKETTEPTNEGTTNTTSEGTTNTTSEGTTNTTSEGTTNTTSEGNTESTSKTPTTVPSLEDYPYQVRGKNGTCILSKMTILLTVNYNTTNNKNNKSTLKVPSTANVSGICEKDKNSMTLTWLSFENNTESVNFADTANNSNMTFSFKKNDSKFSIDQIIGFIYMDETYFPNTTEKGTYTELVTKSDLNLFSSATNSKYVCNVNTVVEEDNLELSITNVELIAFNEDDSTISSKSINDCTTAVLSESANVGAIVGGIIGALVVIGIIGFIIWRRRRNSSVRSEVA
ncbi:lysosome-associated membrane glycoprotein 2-like [Vespa crabro]|uniref:lysosome-associated membrane glycoprotein 2-like n=1 Tax=Vespa crabro TaxID=7445 RepID=UPI001EFFDB3B|nr:lysosome-associated membrane glycoprotein 2-like [Vespa crabro]